MKLLFVLLFCSLLLVACGEEAIVCKDVALDCQDVYAFYRCGPYIKEVSAMPGKALHFFTAGCLPEIEHTEFFCPVGFPDALSEECDEAIHYTCELIKECP